ncbi:MAG TPA: DNA repair protein RecO [Candidatus Nanoarchaeia archaeon]|nr:DNA repair protein RecO [uncultured archaeon]
MNSFATEAVVLKRRDFGEADRLVTFFTKRKGKVVALAKGVRKVTSRRAPNIELLNHVRIFLHETKGLPILTEAEEVESFKNLKGDLRKLSISYLVLELVDQFFDEGQKSEEIFDLFVKTIRGIDGNPEIEKARILQGSFQIKLLTQVGYLPELYRCAKCGDPLVPQDNFLSPNIGGLVDEACNRQTLLSKKASVETVKTLRFLKSKPVSLVEKLKVAPNIVKETTEALNFYTTFFLERDLSSPQFAAQVDKVFLRH